MNITWGLILTKGKASVLVGRRGYIPHPNWHSSFIPDSYSCKVLSEVLHILHNHYDKHCKNEFLLIQIIKWLHDRKLTDQQTV